MKVDFKSFIAIGDQAGRYDEMIQAIDAIKKGLCLPDDIPIISLGDPNDRGRDSKKVFEYFMADTKNRFMVQSNHAHMMLDFYENNGTYDDYIFLGNGGLETAKSYGVTITNELEENIAMIWSGYHTKEIADKTREMIVNVRTEFAQKVPKEHIDFIKSCPMSIETDEVIMTHAPINPTLPIPEDGCDLKGDLYKRSIAFIWNKGGTRRRDKFQLHGHMAHKKVVDLADRDGVYGMDIDTSYADELTVLHWPSKVSVSVPYIK